MKSAVLVPASLVVLVVVSWCMTSPSGFRPPVSGAPSKKDDPATHVATPETRIEGIGFVEPLTEVRKLVFKADGVIAHCSAEVGRTYKKGDVLMELDNREQQRRDRRGRGGMGACPGRSGQGSAAVRTPIKSSRQSTGLRLLQEQDRSGPGNTSGTPRWRRPAPARSRNMTGRPRERNQRRAELQQAEADLRHLRHSVRDEDRCLAEAKVVASRARLDLEREELEGTILRAPCDGTVLEVLKREGDGARRLDPEPVILFADTSRLRVRAEVDERFVGELRVGQRTVVFGRGLRDQQYRGRVVLVKAIMGKKTVFSRSAAERKDLDVVQVMVEVEGNLTAPVGLEVRVAIDPESGTDLKRGARVSARRDLRPSAY